MKKVIVYYSYRGNTKSIAEMIQKSTGADIARIETVVPYDGDYNSVVNQGQNEVNSGYCPKIKPLNIDLSKYNSRNTCLVVHFCPCNAHISQGK